MIIIYANNEAKLSLYDVKSIVSYIKDDKEIIDIASETGELWAYQLQQIKTPMAISLFHDITNAQGAISMSGQFDKKFRFLKKVANAKTKEVNCAILRFESIDK